MSKKKIDALLKLTEKSQAEIADGFDMSKQSMNRKIKNSLTAYDLGDLIKLADLTDTTLAFNDKDGNPLISFDMSDLEQTPKK